MNIIAVGGGGRIYVVGKNIINGQCHTIKVTATNIHVNFKFYICKNILRCNLAERSYNNNIIGKHVMY